MKQATTKQSSHFKVYSPMWRAVKNADVSAPEPAPDQLRPPETWPQSDRLADWGLGAAMNRGAAVLAEHACIGEDRAGAARGFSGWPRGAVQGMPGFPGRRRHVAAVGKPRLGRDRAAHSLASGAQGVRGRGPRRRAFPERTGLARVRLSPRLPHAPDHPRELAPGMGRVPVVHRRRRRSSAQEAGPHGRSPRRCRDARCASPARCTPGAA